MNNSFHIENPELEALFRRHRDNPDGYVFAPLADACRKAGMLEEAIEICEKGVSLHPTYASGFVVRGKCYYDIGNTDQAEASFEKVLELDASNLVALKYMGLILAERGHATEARERFEMILVLDPDDKDIRAKLAELDGMEMADPAASFADVAEEVAPESSAVEAEGSQPADEEEDIDAFYAAHFPEQTDEKAEDPEKRDVEDESFVGEEISLGSEGPTPDELATMTLADIYAAQGYRGKARKIYRDLLSKQPGNEDARRKLEALNADDAGHDREPGVQQEESAADAEPHPAEPANEPRDEAPEAPTPPEPARKPRSAKKRRSPGAKDEPRDPAAAEQFRRWLENMSG